jgi:chemotaxis signal transduction protein
MTAGTMSTPTPTERALCLLFRAGGERFAIRAADVQKVTPLGLRSCLPRLPPAIHGISQHRGRIVTVVDAAIVLGVSDAPSTPRDPSRLLLLERPVRHVGLLVDGVDEIEAIALPADLSGLPRGARGAVRIAQLRGKAVSLVDAAVLVEDIAALLG